MADADPHRYGVKPVIAALRILEALARAGGPLAAAELAAMTGTSRTTAFRHLKTLVLLGFAEMIRPGLYEIGPAAAALGRDAGPDRPLLAIAERHVDALGARFGETVNLAVPNGKRLRYIRIKETAKPLRFRSEEGDSECFHCTAVGKAILAFVPRERVPDYLNAELQRFTAHTLVTRRALDIALAETRRFGYAIDDEENEIGCVCYAAPIFAGDGQPVAAISVSVPTARLTDRLGLDIPQAVVEAARAITQRMARSETDDPGAEIEPSRRGARRQNATA
ncbi:IclR family acetate operon transcriptional repressor [Kaistia hirudinis]|uniref:IclR family acetate operon transcriptional repressor n=1 Tax=Kaistia hirudinis TaxID=1293440 RepID=A0A840AVY8_9HYPH|nr:IclR family transcriptional regulator [Kaistia hirudinis]MBB3933794.1 IclR family acetate operon transcriptional repressor [Kaistia hirudinis]